MTCSQTTQQLLSLKKPELPWTTAGLRGFCLIGTNVCRCQLLSVTLCSLNLLSPSQCLGSLPAALSGLCSYPSARCQPRQPGLTASPVHMLWACYPRCAPDSSTMVIQLQHCRLTAKTQTCWGGLD